MTANIRDLVTTARRCPEAAWREGKASPTASKAGVILDDLCPAAAAALILFERPWARSAKLMATLDAINARHGRGTVFPAAAGVERGWSTRAGRVSPRYTTSIADLAVARA